MTRQAPKLYALASGDWFLVVRALSRFKGKRFNLGALFKACTHQYVDDGVLVLSFGHPSHKERSEEELADPVSMKAVKDTMEKVGVVVDAIVCVSDNYVPRDKPRGTGRNVLHMRAKDGRYWVELHEQDEVIREDGVRSQVDRLCIWKRAGEDGDAHTWLTALTVDEMLDILEAKGVLRS